jgi:hypothetical protein
MGLFLLVPIAGLTFWLVAAPMPRYAGALFWMLGAGSLAIVLRRYQRGAAQLFVLLATVLFFCLNVNMVEFLLTWRMDTGPAGQVPLKAMKTESGLTLHVSQESDRCWDGPLPCTPYFNPHLRLRVPGELGSGFVNDAETDARWSLDQ